MKKSFLGLAFNVSKPHKTGANRVEQLFDLQSFIQAKRIRQKQNGTILFCHCNYRTDGIRFSGFGESFVMFFAKIISRRKKYLLSVVHRRVLSRMILNIQSPTITAS